MTNEYVLLAEKEEMWARMLLEVLEDNHVPCTVIPVHGAGFTIKTGTQERLKVYVPTRHRSQAAELLEALFSAEIAEEELL